MLKGEKGDFTPTREMKPFPDRACKEPCLAAGRWDFWTRQRVQPGWHLGADEGKFLYCLCIYISILGCAQRWRQMTGLHSSEHVAHQHLARHCFVHRPFLTPADSLVTCISAKLEISCQAEAPHVVGACTVWTWTMTTGPKWLCVQKDQKKHSTGKGRIIMLLLENEI